MASITSTNGNLQIGETAGHVWHALKAHGPLTMAKLAKLVKAHRDTVMQGVGWLAREGKVELQETPRGSVVVLRE